MPLVLIAFLECRASADDDPRTPPAKEAAGSYRRAKENLDREYEKDHDRLLGEYVAKLTKARGDALSKNDLDEAQRIVVAIREIESVRKSSGLAKQSETFQVLKAYWGAADHWADVTANIQRLVKNHRLELNGLPAGFPDPVFGTHKTLIILYTLNGKTFAELSYRDPHASLPPKPTPTGRKTARR